jgi:membrane fusion protein (multidrug efflux system)
MRYVIAIFGLILLIGALAGIKGAQIGQLIGMGEEMKKMGPPPEVVGTHPAVKQTWEDTLSAVASVVTAKGVALSNDSPGVVTRLHFESADLVEQGELLVELDTNVERAQLASLRAQRGLAETSLKRSEALVKSGATSQSQLDADASSFQSLTAQANALQAQIERKIIRAPFKGKLGIRQVNLGQYLAPGTVITTLESDESLFVDFALPQQEMARLQPGLPVRAVREGAREPIAVGSVSAVDPTIDEVTRTIKIRASMPDDAKLRPGMFVRAEVVLPQKNEVVAVPVTAIVHASYGDSVFIVEDKTNPQGKPGKVARQQFVRTGGTRGDFVAILEGVSEGQETVAAGAFKLRNGAPVVVNNQVKPEPKLEPQPENR